MKKVILFTEGSIGEKDKRFALVASPNSQLIMLHDGPRFIPATSGFTAFNLVPALTTLAAGKDPLLVTIGTGTEIPTKTLRGGVNIKTQATSPADNDNAMLIGVAASPSFVTWDATAASAIAPRFRTRVRLSQITELVFGAGLDQNITSPIGSATAGDGAQFLFDPANELSTGVSTYATNWILAQKVNAVYTYTDSGIAVLANVDYELEIRWSSDLKPSWYINGALVGTSTTAQTDDTAVGVVIGVQINAASPAGQKDFDCRYVQLDPNWLDVA